MLKITAEQLTAMRDVPREAYHERMFHLARTAFADFVGSLDDDALRAWPMLPRPPEPSTEPA